MKPKTLTPLKSLNKAYQKQKPHRTEFENFKQELALLFNTIEDSESEEYNKNLIRDFLKHTSFDKNNVNTKGRTDLAIYLGNDAKSPIGIIAEIKKPTNKNEMISKSDINFKAMHEVILYYLMERVDNKNDDIKYIIVSNVYEWFIFDAQVFEKIFYKNPQLLKNYNNWKNNKKVSNNTHHFYENIAEEFLKESNEEIEFTYFNLNDYKKYLSKGNSDKKLIPLYKVLNRTHLLKESFVNDSNTLDKKFYLELLHILGLEEIKEGSKKVITRKSESSRESGSLLENTISKLEAKDITSHIANVKRFGETKDEQLNNIALELNIIWINRILFLKLLEAQLVNYHKGDNSYKFLDKHSIAEFDDLHELFHEVLAIQIEKRKKDVRKKFQKIPYLNSSLFEFSNIERNTLDISSLKDRYELSIYSSTVLKKDRDSKKLTGKLSTLDYLLKFLDAYDFSSDSAGDIQEENKNLINASVLGLIFEKINGYKEGSFYTPGFITMYMSREVIRKAVLQKCNEKLDKNYTDFEELKNNIEYSSPEVRDKINKITNDIKICDPAVGSGHFLVSSLNEILSIKSELGILTYLDGSRVHDYKIIPENDELIITNVETEELFDYHLNDKGNPIESLQRLQELLFEEKRKIIENCLFGVDINPNSVNICRLRLWIELLKSSFYTKESEYEELETLPNIDINIKQGNSLISKFELDADISSILKTVKWKLEDYKNFVAEYKESNDKESKRAISKFIDDIKEKINEQLSSTHPVNQKLNRLRKEYYTKYDTVDAFESVLTPEQKTKKKKEKEKLEKKLDSATKDKLQFTEGKIYREAFEWRFEFPEVLDHNGKFIGFDVVIGNPPYIFGGSTDISKPEKELYKKNFKTGTGKVNLFILFIERGLSLLKNNQFFTMIVPNTFLRVTSYNNARKEFISNYKFHSIVDFGDTVFNDAITTAVSILTQKTHSESDDEIVIVNDEAEVNKVYKLDIEKADFVISTSVNKADHSLIRTLYNDSVLLGDIAKELIFGVVITRNRDELISSEQINDYKPFLEGKDIGAYYINQNHNYINYDPKKLHRARTKTIFEAKEKILIQRITGGKRPLKATYDNKQYYNKESINNLILREKCEYEYKYILGIINSKLINWFYSVQFTNKSKLTVNLSKEYLSKIPIKKVSKEKQQEIITEVDKLLKTNKSTILGESNKILEEIDRFIYSVYDLSRKEIEIIEEFFE